MENSSGGNKLIIRNAIAVIILFVFLTSASTIDVIYNNREYIYNLSKNRERYHFVKGTILKGGRLATELQSYLKKNKKVWVANKKYITNTVLDNSYHTTSYVSFVADSIIARIIITAAGEEEYAKRAIGILHDDVSIPLLIKNKREIKNILRKIIKRDCVKNGKKYKKHIDLLSHMELSSFKYEYVLYMELMAMAGVNFDTLKTIIPKIFHRAIPDNIYARYGDRKKEEKILRNYLEEKDYKKKKKILEKICAIGSQKCIDTLICYYWEPIYRRSVGCTSEFFAVPITEMLLQRYLPAEDVLLQKFSKIRTIKKNWYLDDEYQDNYNKEYEYFQGVFNNWAQTKFNIIPINFINSEKIFYSPCRK